MGGPAIDFFLTAANGGRVSGPGALNNQDGALIWISWALFKQNDGSYAFQTNSGSYLTANEGGIGGTFRTDATTIGNWEKFTVIDNGDCTCYIKTYGGYYLTLSPVNEQYIVTTTDITKATKWKTMVIAL